MAVANCLSLLSSNGEIRTLLFPLKEHSLVGGMSRTKKAMILFGTCCCFSLVRTTKRFSDPIERFIDENKALIRRMYGEFQTPSTSTSPPLSSSSSSSSTSSSSAASTSTSRRSVKREAIAESMPNMRDAEFFFGDLEGEYPSIFDGLGATKRPRRQANRTNQTSNK